MPDNKPLTSRERVLRLINRQAVDRIPKGELCIDEDVLHTAGYPHGGFDELSGFIDSSGLDLITLSPEYPERPARLPVPSEYHWPDLSRWVSQTSLFTFAILDGAFEWGMRLFGALEFLPMMVRSSSTVQEFIDQVESINLSVFENLEAAGIDGIILADDIAASNGVFIRPSLLRSTILPSLARQVEAISSKNIPVFFHSDGDYSLVIEDIVGTGIAGLHCLDKNAGMEIGAVQGQLGDRVCLWGHLDIGDIARSSDPSFRAHLVEDIHLLAEQGRFMLGTTSGLFTGMDIHLLKEIYAAV